MVQVHKKPVSMIAGTGSFAPPKVLTNFDMEKMFDTSDEWIRTRTGIRERRIVEEGTITSDLCKEASLEALEEAKVKPEDLDMANDFDCVRVGAGDATAQVLAVIYILHPAKYAGGSIDPTAD